MVIPDNAAINVRRLPGGLLIEAELTFTKGLLQERHSN
jgi:hypothetical protein